MDLTEFNKSIDRAFQKKVVARAREFVKDVGVRTFRLVSSNSALVGYSYGSPVLTGRYYASHTIALNTIDTSVKAENPQGADNPYSGAPIQMASLAVKDLKLGDTIYIANSLPYAQKLEEGYSRFKTPDGIYSVAAEKIKVQIRNVNISNRLISD